MGTVHRLWPPPKRKPAGCEPTGLGIAAGSIAIVQKSAAAGKDCAGCGIGFRPWAQHHRYCRQCFRGAMALRHLSSARRLLNGTGG